MDSDLTTPSRAKHEPLALIHCTIPPPVYSRRIHTRATVVFWCGTVRDYSAGGIVRLGGELSEVFICFFRPRCLEFMIGHFQYETFHLKSNVVDFNSKGECLRAT